MAPSLFDRSELPSLVKKPPPIAWTAPTSLPSLKGAKKIAVDVETNDPKLDELGPGVRRGAYIAGVAIGIDDGPRYYLPIRHEGGGNLDAGIVMRNLKREFAQYKGEVHGTSLLYDLDFLAEEGVEFDGRAVDFHDVSVAEVLIDEWQFSYGLDAIAKKYLGEGKDEALLREAAAAHGWTTHKEIKKNLWRLPAGYAGPYAEGDVDRPLRINAHQMPIIAEQGLETIHRIERKLMPILLGMRRRGVRVDVEHAERVRADLVKRQTEQLKILRSFAGPKAQLTEVATWIEALKDRGLEMEYTPPSANFPNGQISTRKAWLEKNKRDPMVACIMEARKYETIINTFIDGHVRTHAIRGRIHAEFNQLKNDEGRGTAARLSGSNPNMQNIPGRDEELAPLIRGIFIPDEGELWQRDDYSQIEYRLLVHFAVGRGAEEARQRYRDDPKTDYHKFVATMLGVDPEDKVRRKRVKNTNFAKGYGAQVPKLAETFGCSIPEAEAFVKEYEEAIPFSVDTFNAAERWGKKRGFVVTVLNRRHRFPLWEPMGSHGKKRPAALPHEQALEKYGPRIQRANAYKALNNKLQGSSADITKKAMVDAYEAGIYEPDALGFPLVTVHDESGTSVGTSAKSDEAGRELTRIMERAVELRVPVLVESERGKNWGECK